MAKSRKHRRLYGTRMKESTPWPFDNPKSEGEDGVFIHPCSDGSHYREAIKVSVVDDKTLSVARDQGPIEYVPAPTAQEKFRENFEQIDWSK